MHPAVLAFIQKEQLLFQNIYGRIMEQCKNRAPVPLPQNLIRTYGIPPELLDETRESQTVTDEKLENVTNNCFLQTQIRNQIWQWQLKQMNQGLQRNDPLQEIVLHINAALLEFVQRYGANAICIQMEEMCPFTDKVQVHEKTKENSNAQILNQKDAPNVILMLEDQVFTNARNKMSRRDFFSIELSDGSAIVFYSPMSSVSAVKIVQRECADTARTNAASFGKETERVRICFDQNKLGKQLVESDCANRRKQKNPQKMLLGNSKIPICRPMQPPKSFPGNPRGTAAVQEHRKRMSNIPVKRGSVGQPKK